MDKQLLFESTQCSRCLGSKVFTCWSHIQGGACFKCGGKGETLTKRGAAAQAFLNDLRMVPTSDLVVGDKILNRGISCGSFATKSKWCEILEIKPDTLNKGLVIIECDGVSLHVEQSGKQRRAMSAKEKKAAIDAALKYQETLTKQGKPRKR